MSTITVHNDTPLNSFAPALVGALIEKADDVVPVAAFEKLFDDVQRFSDEWAKERGQGEIKVSSKVSTETGPLGYSGLGHGTGQNYQVIAVVRELLQNGFDAEASHVTVSLLPITHRGSQPGSQPVLRIGPSSWPSSSAWPAPRKPCKPVMRLGPALLLSPLPPQPL